MIQRAFILLGIAAGILLAYTGGLQPGLDKWVEGDMLAARDHFEWMQQGDQPELARLNRIIAEAELLRDSLKQAATMPDSLQPLRARERMTALAEECARIKLDDKLRHVVLYHTAMLQLDAGDRDTAILTLRQAYRTKPALQYISDPLLELLMAGGDSHLLRQTAMHQIEIRPDNATAWWALGKADLVEGMPRRALSSWKRGIATVPLRPLLEDAICLALDLGERDLAQEWLRVLRFRYGSGPAPAKVDSLCHSLGHADVANLLPPDTEAGRYAIEFHEFFPEGREWVYSVKYGFIPLGTLIVGVKERVDLPRSDGTVDAAYRVYYKIDSNPIYRLLIDLHDYYEAVIPAHCLHCEEFLTYSLSGDERYDRIYEFDVEKMRMEARGYHVEGDLYRFDLPIARQLFDGLSLLFAARRQVREQRFGPVMTIIDEEVHRTVIENDGRDRMRILGRPAETVLKVHGTADYQGIAGLTGEFWGTFTSDVEALPVAARFQIILGKVSLRLEEVRNGGR